MFIRALLRTAKTGDNLISISRTEVRHAHSVECYTAITDLYLLMWVRTHHMEKRRLYITQHVRKGFHHIVCCGCGIRERSGKVYDRMLTVIVSGWNNFRCFYLFH